MSPFQQRFALASVISWLLLATFAAAQDESRRGPRPAPRWPDGTINLGAPPGETGKWEGAEPLATDPNNYEARLGRALRPGRVHIDTVGFNEGAWMDRFGLPHTDRLHMVERVTRLDFNTLDTASSSSRSASVRAAGDGRSRAIRP